MTFILDKQFNNEPRDFYCFRNNYGLLFSGNDIDRMTRLTANYVDTHSIFLRVNLPMVLIFQSDNL